MASAASIKRPGLDLDPEHLVLKHISFQCAIRLFLKFKVNFKCWLHLAVSSQSKWWSTSHLWINLTARRPGATGSRGSVDPTFSSTWSTCSIWPPLYVNYSDCHPPLFITLQYLSDGYGFYYCLSVVFLHNIKPDTEMSNDELWKFNFSKVKRSKVKMTGHKSNAHISLCTLVSAGFFSFLLISHCTVF